MYDRNGIMGQTLVIHMLVLFCVKQNKTKNAVKSEVWMVNLITHKLDINGTLEDSNFKKTHP